MSERVVAVILAAGAGTRMRSRTAKPLHTIAGRPMIDFVVSAAASVEPDAIVVVLSPTLANDNELTAHLTSEDFANAQIAIQREAQGTGDALKCALPAVGRADRVLVLFADHPLLTSDSVRAMLATSREADSAIVLLTCVLEDAAGYGRIDREIDGSIVRIVERKDDDQALRSGQTEVNSGMMVVDGGWMASAVERLTASRQTGEYYLTELVELAVADGLRVSAVHGQAQELIGINDRVDLARVEEVAYERNREKHQRNGVTVVSPSTVLIESDVTIGQDTVILPGSIIRAGSAIGSGCEIGPNSILTNATIADNCRVTASFVTDSTVRAGSDVGPFSHVRGNSVIETGVHVGNFAEIKNSTLAAGVRMGHFGYAGDATVGAATNIGAGTVTCNYDGKDKHRTVIGERVFIGSDSMLVAPVTIGDGAILGAGSVVTRDVAPGETVFGVPARSKGGQPGKGEERG